MAVLKDLIVHGSSRFLNDIRTNTMHANLIDVNDGIFKTITTTTLDAETITADMLTATNARVSQTLTVDGTISTNKWEAANIANIGGNFYISPTGKADSGTITVTKTSTTTVNGVSVGVYTLVVGSASFGVTSTSSTIWGPASGNQSKVIFTGSISYGNSKKYPLGTCNGTMTVLSPGTNTLTGFTITGVNSPALDIFFKEVGISSVSSIACSGYEMQISVYQSYYSSALHPIGILLTSYGKEKKQYIDIYGGANTLSDSTSGFANPSLRIGQLDGLPNIVDGSDDSATQPSGWGIYTDNGFFKGKIVASAGRIGSGTAAWTIGNNGTKAIIYTGTRGSADSAYLSTGVGTESIGGSGTLNTTNDGYWAFTAGANFGVTTKGKLFANSAKISGNITATSGTIGGASIENGTLKIGEGNIIAGSIKAEHITTDDIEGTNGSINLRSGIFNFFNEDETQGISWDGNSLNISGAVNITSGNIVNKLNIINSALGDKQWAYNYGRFELTDDRSVEPGKAYFRITVVEKQLNELEEYYYNAKKYYTPVIVVDEVEDISYSGYGEITLGWSEDKTFEEFLDMVEDQSIPIYLLQSVEIIDSFLEDDDPLVLGYYEVIDFASTMQDYIVSHLSLDSLGLHISGEDYSNRIDISQNDGVIIYKDNKQVAQYGESTIIGDPADFHIEVTANYKNTNKPRLSFYRDNENEVAYISEDKLYITKSVVLEQMDLGEQIPNGGLGQWSWKIHEINEKNNLYLKWLG